MKMQFYSAKYDSSRRIYYLSRYINNSKVHLNLSENLNL